MGGNVVFGDHAADRIDLQKLKRKDVVNTLTTSLLVVNDAFKRKTGFPLWQHDIRDYLSGSTDSLFDPKISDEQFVAFKPSVGDIDTQVNGIHDDQIRAFLEANKGKKFGDLTLLGSKKSVDQWITLWKSKRFGINIQVDLEMVDFGKDGRPTPWSRFSHSSSWDDMVQGIKGIAHKYVFRALTAMTLHDVIIRPKTSRGKEKEQKASIDAFSPKGYRTKLKPALDEAGKHIYKNGLPVYDEMSVSDTGTVTDIEVIFEAFFKHTPSKNDLKLMESYTGVLQLIKKYVPADQYGRISDGMAHLLFGKGAQNMYRNDNERDLKEKTTIIQLMASALGLAPNRWDSLINAYYAKG